MIRFPLETTRPKPEPLSALERSLTRTLEHYLDPRGLTSPYRKYSKSWVSRSLLEVVAKPRELAFEFDGAVRWPSRLAEHWMMLALARHWLSVEEQLANLGYAVRGFPSFGDLFYRGSARFFESHFRIGWVPEDRSRVDWVLDRRGSYDLPSTPWGELAADDRDAATAMLEAKRCACPYCRQLEKALPRSQGKITLEACEKFAADYPPMIARASHPSGKRILFVTNTTLRAPSMKGPWKTFDSLKVARRTLILMRAYDRTKDALVICARPNEEDEDELITPQFWASRDFGGTFSKLAVRGLPKGKAQFTLGWDAGAEVHAAVGLSVFRSTNAGRTWTAFGRLPWDASLFQVVRVSPKVALALIGESWDRTLVRMTDGKKWKPVVLPDLDDDVIAISLVVGKKAIGCAAQVRATKTSIMLRSTDEGASWTAVKPKKVAGDVALRGNPRGAAIAAPSGRWYWAAADVLRYSDDEGATWSYAARAGIEAFFVDDDALWAASTNTLFRVHVQ